MKKWYTCTPVPFKGDSSFFYRDSGLFSRCFEEAGCESRAIMPGPAQEGDWPNLIRTEYRNLEDPEWWKALNVDGVLLYSWGSPKFEKVARAIKKGGIKLVICLDTSWGFYPFYDWAAQTKFLYSYYKTSVGRFWLLKFIWRLFKANVLGVLYIEPYRKKHLSHADRITVPLPDLFKKLTVPNIFYGDFFKKRLSLVCPPAASHFIYDGTLKEKQVIAVGRWDDVEVKRPFFLMGALQACLSKNKEVKMVVVGRGIEQIERWRDGLPSEDAARVALFAEMPNTDLVGLYKRSRISLCTSAKEGTHVVSTEALCCGCSVVAPEKVSLSAFSWYVSEESGTLAKEDTPESMAEAILAELEKWDAGERNPGRIACIWGKRFHGVESVKRILEWDETGVMPGFEDCSG